MLVLTRRIGEKIIIGSGPDAVTVMIVDVDRNKIRVGISAPRDVPIFREELLPIRDDEEGAR